MKIKVIEFFGDGDCYVNGEYVGNLQVSIGPHGESSGIFRRCRTTTPITEMFGGENILLVNRWDIPYPDYR